MFRRRRGADDADEVVVDDLDDASSGDGATRGGGEGDRSQVDPLALSPRTDGPFDITEDFDEESTLRLDFGSLQVPAYDGMQIQLEVDEETAAVSTVNVLAGDSVLALSAFAAPRGEGLWTDVVADLRRGIADGGGLLDTVPGEHGVELRAQVPSPDNPGLVPVRFVGVDGPRWFLRGVFTGSAAHGEPHSAVLDAVLRATVVSRGTEPMAPGDLLPLRVPEHLPPSVEPTGPDAPDG